MRESRENNATEYLFNPLSHLRLISKDSNNPLYLNNEAITETWNFAIVICGDLDNLFRGGRVKFGLHLLSRALARTNTSSDGTGSTFPSFNSLYRRSASSSHAFSTSSSISPSRSAIKSRSRCMRSSALKVRISLSISSIVLAITFSRVSTIVVKGSVLAL